eukprot:jgi/Mesvir1/7087/Mv09193-RA.4
MQAEEDVEEGEIPSNEKEGSDGGEDCDQARGHLKTDGMERAAGKKRSGHQFEGAAHPHGDHGAHAAKKARPDGTQGPSVADGGRKGKKKQKFLDVYGSDARADLVLKMNEKRNNRLKMKDIQDLILWVLGERESPGSPNWVFIKNKPLVSKVVVVLLHGLGSHHYYHCAELFPNLKRCCGEPVALDGIGDTISALATAKALITIAPSKTMQKKLKKEEERSKAMARQQLSQPFDLSKVPGPLSQYLLKEEDMRLFNFPMATLDEEGKSVLPEGFVKTRSLLETGGQLAPDRELVSMDCEMCYTKNGLEVTRATLVDARGKVLYDKLVLPDDPITDYNTRYSGITAKMMENVTNRVADVQREFLDLISAETILVGHSLENDLKCIKMLHDRIIDTSVLYKHPRGGTHKFALRQLAANYLERYIQSGNHGHDSVEDAVAALDLVRLKLMNGPSFGNFHDESAGRNLMDALHADTGKACVMVDRGRGLHTYGARTASSICCETDKQVRSLFVPFVSTISMHGLFAPFVSMHGRSLFAPFASTISMYSPYLRHSFGC